MLGLLKILNQKSQLYLITLGVVSAVLVGLADYVTGSEFVISIFYLIPIALIAWFVGRRGGMMISLLCALLSFIADFLAKPVYPIPTVPYWNTTMLFGMFLIVTYALSSLHDAQERRQELEQFIVHDLRSPLANVMTGLEALHDFGADTLDVAEKNVLETCLISCRRMLLLINSLLDLAHLEGRLMPLQRELLDLTDLVDEARLQISILAQHHHIGLAYQVPAEVDAVYADRDLVVRVLVNLLSNAIKFSPANTSITVQVSSQEKGWAAFRVTDQGRGMSQAWANRVFDKFVQVDAHKAGRGVGSGLGLTFCREAVEAQGGRIWIESEPGRGTTVTFTLPTQASSLAKG